MPFKRLIYFVCGIVLVPLGIIIAPLPGPFGLPVAAAGVVMLIYSSPRIASWIRLYRRRWDWLHETLRRGETLVGGEFGAALRRTNGRRGAEAASRAPLTTRQALFDIVLLPFHMARYLFRLFARRFFRR